MAERIYRVAVVAIHPIQYMAGLWRRMAAHPRLDVHVIYLDTIGIDGTIDPTLNAPMEWDIPLLDGYSHDFVRNLSPARFTPIVGRINPGLPAALLKGNYDAIVAHGYLNISSWLLLATAAWTGAAVFYRGEGSLRTVSPSWGRLLSTVREPIQAFYMRRCAAIACSSGDNRDYQLSRGAPADRLFPMPCAIDQEQLDSFRAQARSRAETRAAYGLPADAPVLVSVTRFTDYKRPFDTLAAIENPPMDGRSDVHLVFVGDGPEHSALEARARERGLLERVHFLGFLNQRAMVEVLCACDVFVLPSERDPSPKSLSEAAYLGLPAVCSESIGTGPDFVEHGTSGRLFPTGDIDAYAQALADVLRDPAMLQAMGRRSSELASASDFQIGVDNFVQRIDQLLGGSPT